MRYVFVLLPSTSRLSTKFSFVLTEREGVTNTQVPPRHDDELYLLIEGHPAFRMKAALSHEPMWQSSHIFILWFEYHCLCDRFF